MKSIFFFVIIFLSSKIYSQYVTHAELDSAFATLDSVVVKPIKITITNATVPIDTLITDVNTTRSFQLSVETDSDNTIKNVMIKNRGGIYSIITDYDMQPFSFNRKGNLFNSRILYQVTSSVINNRVIISAVGQSGTTITWKLSRTRL